MKKQTPCLSRGFLEMLGLVVLALSPLVNAGCSHLRPIGACTHIRDVGKVNKALAGKKARIVLTGDERERAAENVWLAADSVCYVEAATGRTQRLPICDISRITAIDHARGAVDGFGKGLLAAGMVFGAAVVVASRTDVGSDSGNELAGAVGIFAAVETLSVLGSPLRGAPAGSKMIYLIDSADKTTRGKRPRQTRSENL